MVPAPPEDILPIDKRNYIVHFNNRAAAEDRFFGKQTLPDRPVLEVTGNNLNSDESSEFIQDIKPDITLIFGCGLIKDPLFSALPKHAVNLHLGLSPRYRGDATLFWPFYFMEPNFTGATFHYIVAEPDAGDIVHQVVPKLEPNDGIHDVACKTVIASSEDAVKLIEIFEKTGVWTTFRQKGTGKHFLNSDFKPEHLRVIYNVFKDDMVDKYLEGKWKCKKPKLVRQF